ATSSMDVFLNPKRAKTPIAASSRAEALGSDRAGRGGGLEFTNAVWTHNAHIVKFVHNRARRRDRINARHNAGPWPRFPSCPFPAFRSQAPNCLFRFGVSIVWAATTP